MGTDQRGLNGLNIDLGGPARCKDLPFFLIRANP